MSALLNNLELYYQDPEVAQNTEIIYIYNTIKPSLSRPVHYHQGLPTCTELIDFVKSIHAKNRHSVIVFDDEIENFLSLKTKDQNVWSSFITDGSRKYNASLILISQYLFIPKLHLLQTFRTCSTAYILFGQPGNLQSISSLGSQICGSKAKKEIFLKSYAHATGLPFGYLMVHLKSSQSPISEFQLRSYIAPPSRPSAPDSPVFNRETTFDYTLEV